MNEINPQLVNKYRKLLDDIKARILSEEGITLEEVSEIMPIVTLEIVNQIRKQPLSFLPPVTSEGTENPSSSPDDRK
jgi:hypothetical protein